LLQPLVERYPTSSQIQDLACEMLQESGASPAALVDRCARAAALPDVSASILLVTAQLHLAAGNPSAALPVLARAESKVSEPSAWVWLGQLQLAAGAISAAERAAAHAPQREAAQLRAGCSRTRRFVGFPKAGVAGDREASYVSSALAAHQDIDHHRLPEALKRAAQLALSFPDAPAAAIIECRAKSRGTTLASIQMSCTAAANADSEAFLPRYILGLVAGARHRWGEAEVAMRRALELDETTQEVWASLAAVQRSMRATAALRALEARYKARFGATLTPALFPEGWAAR
jgi:hypothetical protein